MVIEPVYYQGVIVRVMRVQKIKENQTTEQSVILTKLKQEV